MTPSSSRDLLRCALLGLALAAGHAQAHLLKVFAYAEGDQLHGNAYFAGGNPASGAAIEIHRDNGQLLGTLSTDAQGEFGFTLAQVSNLLVTADSGDGHRAEWQISASELGPDLASDSADRSAATDPDAARLALLERAVARQVGPLRRELQASQQRARLGDILGGIGLIVGLTGTLLWWRSRRAVRA